MSSATSNISSEDPSVLPTVLRPDQTPYASWGDAADQSDGFPLLLVFAIAIGLRAIVGLAGIGLEGNLTSGANWAAWSQLGESLVSERSFLQSSELAAGLDREVQRGLATLPQTFHHTATGQPRELVRVPIYAWLVGAINGLGLPAFLLVVVQTLLSGGAASLAFGIVRILQPKAMLAPWIAGMLMAVHPAAIGSTVLLVPATVFVVLLLAAIFVAVQDKWDELPVFGLGGLAAGTAVLTLPYGWALAPILGVAVMVRGRSIGAISRGLVFVACAMIPVGFWMVRNHDLVGPLATTAAPEVFGLYDETNALLMAAEQESDLDDVGSESQSNKTLGQSEMTTRWLATIQEQASPDPIGAMRLVTSHSRQNAGLQRFNHLAGRVLHVATAESVAGLLNTTKATARDFRANRDASTMARESGGSAFAHHAGSLWVTFNILLAGLAVVGVIRLIAQGSLTWGLTLAFIGLHLMITWRPNGDDPMYFAAICLLPILAAAALGYQRSDRAPVVTDKDDDMPEFNVYGLPTKNAEAPQVQEEVKQPPKPEAESFAFGSATTDEAPAPTMNPPEPPSRLI